MPSPVAALGKWGEDWPLIFVGRIKVPMLSMLVQILPQLIKVSCTECVEGGHGIDSTDCHQELPHWLSNPNVMCPC